MSFSGKNKFEEFIVRPRSGKLDSNSLNHLDPYLTIQYGGQWVITKVCKKTEKYPLWTEEFAFKHNEYLQDLFVECWDYNVSHSQNDNFIGKGILKINDGSNSNSLMQWLTLEKGGGAVGEVFFEIDFREAKSQKSGALNYESVDGMSPKKNTINIDNNQPKLKDFNPLNSKPLITKHQLDNLGKIPLSFENHSDFRNERNRNLHNSGSPKNNFNRFGEEIQLHDRIL